MYGLNFYVRKRITISAYSFENQHEIEIVCNIYVLNNINFCSVSDFTLSGLGLGDPDDQINSCQSENSYSMMPKPCNFWYLSFRHVLTKSKIDRSEGLLMFFSHRGVLKIYKMKKNFLCLELLELT